MIYLAIPYTGIEETSHKIANAVLAELTRSGEIVFSPISHSHIMAKEFDLPAEWEFWKRIDCAFIERCDHLLVVCIDGWDESIGVKAEIDAANYYEIPISYYRPTFIDSKIRFDDDSELLPVINIY